MARTQSNPIIYTNLTELRDSFGNIITDQNNDAIFVITQATPFIPNRTK